MSRVSRRTTTRIALGAAALAIAATPALAREAEPGDDRAPSAAPQVVTSAVVTPPAGTPTAAKRHGADDGPAHVRRGRDDAPGHVRHNGADDGPNHR